MNNYTTTILVWGQSLGWAGAGGQGVVAALRLTRLNGETS